MFHRLLTLTVTAALTAALALASTALLRPAQAAAPQATITTVELLDTPVTRLKLVPGVWTQLDLKVLNTGDVELPSVTVTGSGKKLKVQPGATETSSDPGDTRSASVRVKLGKAKRTTLTLTAVAGGVATERVIQVKRAKTPPRPKAGAYESPDGRIHLTITRNGRITGFRAQAYTTCGGYPSLPTHSWSYYDFPTTKVPRNGIVTAVERGSNYTVRLQLKAAGKKVTQGRFNYNGPNRCWAVSNFTAKRT
ncbi:hypothetical protein RB608_06420 [Nocardioides sp. LHD-245]|uniref:hypothetical protein n=1 Tax=Nocardioides sp. LHD-245 TaxID=3051387 RepID=UPI0027DF86CF|nr:hypothetical protein [Nocardioides sp. LHD-245]